MENVSIFYVVLAVATAVISYIRFKKIRVEQIGFFIGSIIGCILMFAAIILAQLPEKDHR